MLEKKILTRDVELGEMDTSVNPFPPLTNANCYDMLPLQREAIANYHNLTGIPRYRRMCEAALAGKTITPTGWTDDMVNMACATVFIRTGVHVEAKDMRAAIERAIETREPGT